MLNKMAMPADTIKVFDALSSDSGMADFVLIGGTALSLQINHRLSEDLDFWVPADRLNKYDVNNIIQKLKAAGFEQQLVTPHNKISEAKINGYDLLEYVQDHSIGGVKVTFLASNRVPEQHFSKLPKIHDKDVSFSIMDKEGVFVMKSWLITQRAKSRDLYDLMVFVKDHGKSLDDIFNAGQAADPTYSKGHAINVLTGLVPLDKDDPGYHSVKLNITPSDVHRFFKNKIDEYERDIAIHIAKKAKSEGFQAGDVERVQAKATKALNQLKKQGVDLPKIQSNVTPVTTNRKKR